MHARRWLAAAGALGALVLAGCGSSSPAANGVASKSPNDIVTSALNAASSARSVHMSGSFVQGSTPLALDLTLVPGEGARGTISQNGISFQLVVLGGTVYINGSPAFLRKIAGAAGNAAVQLLNGKWLKAPATSDFGPLAKVANLHTFFSTTLANHGPLAKHGTATVNGQRVVVVTDTSKGGSLYVAATGKPYPLEILAGKGNSGALHFDKWNESASVTAPANAIDVQQLNKLK